MNWESDNQLKNNYIRLDIKSELEFNSMIEVSQLKGDLTNYNVLMLKDWFLTCLYERKYNQLIDFNQLNKIDRQGILHIKTMLDRGLSIRLFNVPSDINMELIKTEDINIKDKIFLLQRWMMFQMKPWDLNWELLIILPNQLPRLL